MNYKTLKLLSALAGVSLLGGLSVQAQDKATLDLLVKKGYITQAEADQAGKSAAFVVVPKSPTTKKLTIEGFLQFQFDNISANGNGGKGANPPAVNQMYLRRSEVGMIGDFGNGWGGELEVDFSATLSADAPKAGLSPQGSTNNIAQNLFEKAVITKKIDGYGMAMAGYTKVNFIQEENTPSTDLLAIERSPLTRYFDEYYGSPTAYRLAFAQRRTGLFWNGVLSNGPLAGTYYGAAITNGIQSNINYGSVGGLNGMGAWLNAGYKNSYAGLGYDFGLNLGYSSNGNSDNKTGDGLAGVNQRNSTWGWNPYLNLTYGGFGLKTEFVQSQYQNGRSTIPETTTTTAPGATSMASPYGVNITPYYNINDQWQLVARYSYLSTNGRGTNMSDVVWNGPNVNGSTQLFDDVSSVYVGFNYFIIPGAVKLSAGYEWAQFTGRQLVVGGPANFSGPHASENIIRARLQVVF
jgi:hypothetical protein